MDPEQVEQLAADGTDEALDCWAFVEVMGHSKIAGRLTTRKLGVAVLLQVDVLKPDGSGVAYSKFYSPASLFSITPVTEEYCRKWSKQAAAYSFKPVPFVDEADQRRLLVGTGTGASGGKYAGDDGDDGDDDY